MWTLSSVCLALANGGERGLNELDLEVFSPAIILDGNSVFSPVAFYRPWRTANTPERASAQAKRHNGKFNVVFCDGHTESRETNQLFGLRDDVTRLWNRDNEPHHEKTWTDTR